MSGVTTRAVFLDRDGTINVDRNYLSHPEQFELIPGAAAALRRLQDAGFRLIVVTNQSGIGRGYYTEADLHAVNARMNELLAEAGVRLTHVYFSPEAPEQAGRGRKPSPAFFFDARDEWGVDLGRSFMVGDKFIDLEAGWNAGCAASVLVRTGYGAETERRERNRLGKAIVVDDLAAATEWILAAE
ncbi:MAG TPA: D-glycero-beta-D-manno-heptose 1,7-bisphosphate 7-phosphatase [Verrucomicrobiota bacterium]|nr:D-glycero-beta-D-manno-heptose-1,7-bisphosphate 7-phosphatase [Verrucomicrobiales bacterium]HRI14131.1 D-glycero-beta-D-manno-heptose 1,7-bisphosphate 7-phosphatase [Verrucomicrobiota bacterium]